MVRIAVDAMGGDHAPSAIVDGAVAAARHLDAQIALVGAAGPVEAALDSHADWRELAIEIVDAPDEAAVPGRLQGTLPPVRDQLEYRGLQLRAGVGRSPAGAAQELIEMNYA